MPAYSFQERFVPAVLDGSKSNTVRAFRKNRAKPGDNLFLYFGMRTKWCRKLREEKCSDARSVAIHDKHGIIIFDRLLTIEEKLVAERNPFNKKLPHFTVLSSSERDAFAYGDGFRPEGSSKEQPYGAYLLLIRFWRKTHALPFVGDIIYWKPNKANP